MKRQRRGPGPVARPSPAPSTQDAATQTDPAPPYWLEDGSSPFAGRLAWLALTPLFKALAAVPGLASMVQKVSRMPRPLAEGDAIRDAHIWDGVGAFRRLLGVVTAPIAPKPRPINYLNPILESIASGLATDDLG